MFNCGVFFHTMQCPQLPSPNQGGASPEAPSARRLPSSSTPVWGSHLPTPLTGIWSGTTGCRLASFTNQLILQQLLIQLLIQLFFEILFRPAVCVLCVLSNTLYYLSNFPDVYCKMQKKTTFFHRCIGWFLDHVLHPVFVSFFTFYRPVNAHSHPFRTDITLQCSSSNTQIHFFLQTVLSFFLIFSLMVGCYPETVNPDNRPSYPQFLINILINLTHLNITRLNLTRLNLILFTSIRLTNIRIKKNPADPSTSKRHANSVHPSQSRHKTPKNHTLHIQNSAKIPIISL